MPPRRLSQVLLVAVAVVAWSGAGCEDRAQIQKQCEVFNSALCDKLVACELTASRASCDALLGAGADCAKASGWSEERLPTCVSQLEAMACAELERRQDAQESLTPESCAGVISFTP